MRSILNKRHNSKVPSWVTHNLVLCFSAEQGVCHLHSALNVLGLKTPVAINVSLWASIHFPPWVIYIMLQITSRGVKAQAEERVHGSLGGAFSA